MEKIKLYKTAKRASFTKYYIKLESAMANENVDDEEIEICLHLFRQKADSLELTHNEYLSALTDETDFLSEFETVEEYRKKACLMKLKSQNLLEKINSKQNCSESTNFGDNSHLAEHENPSKTISSRLPEIDLHTFGGQSEEKIKSSTSELVSTEREPKNLALGQCSLLSANELFIQENQSKMISSPLSKIYLYKFGEKSEEKIKLSSSEVIPTKREDKNLELGQSSLPSASELCIQENAGPIEVLLGTDVAGKLITGQREELKADLVALETKLNCTLMGEVPRSTDKRDASSSNAFILSQADVPASLLSDLEPLCVQDPIEQNSGEETKNPEMFHFLETVGQIEDGRYEVHLPWKENLVFLTDNYELSLKRLESTAKKFKKSGLRGTYHEPFKEWIDEGVIEEAPGEELSVGTHHHPFIKETCTTSPIKIRPVFDASAKIQDHLLSHDCVEIRKLTSSEDWLHISTNHKPVDILSEELELKASTSSRFLQDLPLNDVPNSEQNEKTDVVFRRRQIQKVPEVVTEYPEPKADSHKTVYVSRSGRKIKPPRRLIL